MRRLLYFFSGIVILVFMTYYLIKTLEVSQLQKYIQLLEGDSAFWYIYYILIGLLFLMGLIFLILAFRPSHKRRKLLWQTHAGELEISKKAIESYIIKSISQYNNVRIQNIKTTLKSRGNIKRINSKIDVLWLPNQDSIEASVDEISEDVKSKLEQFTNADVTGIKIKIIDQEKTDKRVV